jgi:hypothetical protein
MRNNNFTNLFFIPAMLLIGFLSAYSGAEAKLTASSNDTPEKREYVETCYKAATAVLQGELNSKKIDITQFLGRKTQAYNKCADEARAMDVPEKDTSVNPAPVVAPLSTPTPNTWGPAENKYKDRYIQKCLEAYKNDSSVTGCCNILAVEDTNKMQKRGVFDTPTTAEIPIFVDDLKCKAPEYKYDCSDVGKSIGEKDACKKYINQCIEMGKWPSEKEESRKKLCETDYTIQRPLKLDTQEKYTNICLKSRQQGDVEDMDALGIRCQSDYYSGVKEYIDRCVASLNKSNYNAFSNWFIKIRARLFKSSKAKYETQTKECLNRYDQALDNMLKK